MLFFMAGLPCALRQSANFPSPASLPPLEEASPLIPHLSLSAPIGPIGPQPETTRSPMKSQRTATDPFGRVSFPHAVMFSMFPDVAFRW